MMPTSVEPIFDYQFRLILIGDSTVGKSSLLRYFTDGKFAELCDPTVGVDFFARLVEVRPGIRVKLQLWDTAGQERFRSITRSYYRHSVGVIVIYDITNRASFDHASDWFQEAQLHIDPFSAVYIIVGHKTDLDAEREVTFREGKQLANAHNVHFLETSAKTGQNVEETFTVVAKEIYDLIEQGELGPEEGWDGIKDGFGRKTAAGSKGKTVLVDGGGGDAGGGGSCCY